MSGRNVSPAMLRAMLSQESGECPLMCLEINHESLAAPYRFVRDHQPLDRDGAVYEPFPFEISLPDDSGESLPQVELSIGNVDRRLVRLLREIDSPPSVSVFAVLASSPTTIEAGPYELTLRQARLEGQTVTCSLNTDDLLNQSFPSARFTPGLFPGLF